MAGSKGVLDGLMKQAEEQKKLGTQEDTEINNKEDKLNAEVIREKITQEDKNISNEETKNESTEEERIKRGYELKVSTIKKLQELHVFHYPVKTDLQDIVDEAICLLYEGKKGKE